MTKIKLVDQAFIDLLHFQGDLFEHEITAEYESEGCEYFTVKVTHRSHVTETHLKIKVNIDNEVLISTDFDTYDPISSALIFRELLFHEMDISEEAIGIVSKIEDLINNHQSSDIEFAKSVSRLLH